MIDICQGANPDLQDTNGNTVAHMMVIYDKMVSRCTAYVGLAINLPVLIVHSSNKSYATKSYIFYVYDLSQA